MSIPRTTGDKCCSAEYNLRSSSGQRQTVNQKKTKIQDVWENELREHAKSVWNIASWSYGRRSRIQSSIFLYRRVTRICFPVEENILDFMGKRKLERAPWSLMALFVSRVIRNYISLSPWEMEIGTRWIREINGDEEILE